MTGWLTLLAVAATVVWLVKNYSTAHVGPLSKIPGPELNRWTYWPLKLAVISGRRIFYVDSLHAKYGPIVRISPTEVAVADVKAAKEIHRVNSGFSKSKWYQEFTQEEVPAIFSMIDPQAHAGRRRLFGRVFAQSSLNDWEPLLQRNVQLAVSQIKHHAQQGPVNMLDWWTFMATDIIGEMGFGESFKTLESGQKSEYSRDLETVMKLSGLRSELPLLHTILEWIPVKSIQHTLQSAQRIEAYGALSIRRNRILREKGQETPGTLFSKMVTQGEEKALSDYEVEREASNFIVAGSDTTAVTLMYLIWAVMRHPEVRSRLQSEVDTLKPDFTKDDVQSLEYLNMIIQEALRLYGAAPGALPRTVPSGGRQLERHYLPEGAIVSTQAYTLHRLPDVFPDPLAFKPERWSLPNQEMKDAFQPFGAGSRICIGMHLARMELALATTTFFRECPTARLVPSMTDQDMEFENYFLIAPKSHRCDIIITTPA